MVLQIMNLYCYTPPSCQSDGIACKENSSILRQNILGLTLFPLLSIVSKEEER